MTITTTAANPFDVKCDGKEMTYSVIDTRSGALMRCFFVEDGVAGLRALDLADALWYAELTAAPEVAPEPEPSADMALAQLPSYTLIPGSVDSPAEMLDAALAYQHAVNTGRQWLLTFKERPDLWRIIWSHFSEGQQDNVLAGARLAGATPCELNALAGLSYAPGQDALGKPTFASLLVR